MEASDPMNSLPGVSSTNAAGNGLRGGLVAASPWPKSLTPWPARPGASPFTSVARLGNIGARSTVGFGLPSPAIKGVGRMGPAAVAYGLTMVGIEAACAATCSQ